MNNVIINIGTELNVTKAPHILIAGTTGSGKSVCMNSIICNLLIADPGSEFAFIDMKKIELSGYKRLKNCIGYASSVTDAEKLIKKIIDIMQIRFQLLEKYQLKFYPGNAIYFFIDEYADLQTLSKKAEKDICTLARLSRAANIHLFLSLQYPTAAVLNGQIKMNILTRICFRLSKVGSRVVLDHNGAETLPGAGYGIIQKSDGTEENYRNIYISDETIKSIIELNQKGS